ncbi:hypothetical protein MMC29_001773 [Sticta canariensis]|nr:hypothetical protein [Sticta canariensis]
MLDNIYREYDSKDVSEIYSVLIPIVARCQIFFCFFFLRTKKFDQDTKFKHCSFCFRSTYVQYKFTLRKLRSSNLTFQDVSPHRQDARARGSHADRIPCAIIGCVLDEEREGSNDTANVAEANDPGGADDAVGVTIAGNVEVHDVPADDDGTRGKDTHGNEADGQVLDGKGVVDGEKDGEAGDGEDGAKDNEGEAETRVVGHVRFDEKESKSGDDWGHSV